MKKIFAFIMATIMILGLLAPSISVAAEQGQEQVETLTNAVYYNCTYDSKNKQVIVEGTVNHDFMISHANYTISVMAILPGQNFNDVIADPSTESLRKQLCQ